jgi:pectin methylesterase-like acyl-CoA thioesterase
VNPFIHLADPSPPAVDDSLEIEVRSKGRRRRSVRRATFGGVGIVAAVAIVFGAVALQGSPGSRARVVSAPLAGVPVVHVPQDQPTIQAAVNTAPANALVLVSPGRYHESVTVHRNDLTIRGLDRNTVVLDGKGALEQGISIEGAQNITVQNLTATGSRAETSRSPTRLACSSTT